jgi:hypothetical protein
MTAEQAELRAAIIADMLDSNPAEPPWEIGVRLGLALAHAQVTTWRFVFEAPDSMLLAWQWLGVRQLDEITEHFAEYSLTRKGVGR